jgi:integrase
MERTGMRDRLTDEIIARLPVPEPLSAGGKTVSAKIHYDAPSKRGNDYVRGFGVRVTVHGTKSFVLNYRTRTGRERRHTIGAVADWSLTAARDEARKLRAAIDTGSDPVSDLKAGRDAPTVSDLCERFEQDHLPKKRQRTQDDYKAAIRNDIKPELGSMKVADVTFADVDRLHRKITGRGASTQANRTVAILSKMFTMAVRWHMRETNPAKGIERNQEARRVRYLKPEEIKRLSEALEASADKQAANIVRLLMLTGSRSGETMAARWIDFDLKAGVWTKPGSTTKQKTEHRVRLSPSARQLVAKIRDDAADDAEFVFPGRGSPHRTDIKRAWQRIRKKAKLSGVRVHDLRHTYASILVSAGQSLPIIGALLGHSSPMTTARYAHLFDDPLLAAAERADAIIMGTGKTAEILPMSNKMVG